MTRLHVGFIGAGQMGQPMIERLLAAGHQVSVYVRRAEIATQVAADLAGVEVLQSAGDVVATADIVILCLFSDAQLRELMLATSDSQPTPLVEMLRPGARLVNHVTGSPKLAEELAMRLPSGAGYVDAPVTGSADDIRAGRLTVLAGATAEDLDAVRPVLSAYANPILHVGGIGDGQRLKLVNNLMFTANLRIAVDGARIAQSLGIEPPELARLLTTCSGNSYAVALFAHMPPELSEQARPFLAKDVAVVREVADEIGVDLGILGELAEWVDGS